MYMPRRVWFLIVGAFLNTIGNSFLWPLNAIYIHDYLGKSLTVAGIVLMVNSLAGVLGNVVGGYLFDRFGGYKTIVGAVIANLLTLICLVFWHDWPTYVILLTILGFTGGVVFPSLYAIAGGVWPEGGRKAFNAIFLANNVGVAIGPALAGLIADISFEYVFVANLIAYFLFFIVAVFLFRRFDTKPKPRTQSEATGKQPRAPIYAVLILSIALVGCWLAYSQWAATISAHTQTLDISLSQYSMLWTINGLLIVAFQPVVAPLVRYWEQKVKHQLVLGLSLMALSFIIVAYAGDFKMFAAAMVILTLGEVFFAPVIPMIASQLAPEGREGFYQGLVNGAATMGRVLGPLVGGFMVDMYSMKALALILVVILLLSLIPCILYDKPLKSQTK